MQARKSQKSVSRFLRGATADPIAGVGFIASHLYSKWLARTYPFASIGERFFAHHRVELSRPAARYISVGNHVTLDRDVWLNIAMSPRNNEPILFLEDGCVFGRRCIISAKNNVRIGRNCIFGPSVFITDHNHAYDDVTVPIGNQGMTEGGSVRIEEGCWLGFGAAIVCDKGELVIGRNSIVGANSVVSRSIPPYSVAMGHPARIVKQYDPSKKKWVIGTAAAASA